jgi:NTE family protein
MSVPFFFKPFQVFYDRNQMPVIRDEWNKYSKVYKDLGDYALFVDGGMLSNFPINVFNDPSIPLPRKPTLGIKLEYNDESTSDPINNLAVFGSRMVSTMRFFYDRDFLIKNESYRKTVRSVDTGKISWLNFGLNDQQKIELFFRGALSAALFLAGSTSTDTELSGLCEKGKAIPFSKATGGHFNMYEADPRKFECAELDPLLGDVRFSWKNYKQERIEALLLHPVQKNNLKGQASAVE